MAGWIKVEKELLGSIRLRRVVRKVRERNALPGVTDRDEALTVTLCIGALIRLWIYADTHIAQDNTLEATVDELDELVGLPGFAVALPEDWLRSTEDGRVELPDFIEHNGSSAKQRRDNAKRQAQWRHRQRNADVTTDNARNAARPDQDQTKTSERGKARAARSSRVPPEFEPDREYAKEQIPDLDVDREVQKFRDWEFKTPKSDWAAAWRNWIANALEKGSYSRINGKPLNALDPRSGRWC